MATRGTRRTGRARGGRERLDGYVFISVLVHGAAALALILWGPTFSGGAPAPPVPIRVVSEGDLGGPAPAAPAAASAPAAPRASRPGPPRKTASLASAVRKPLRPPAEVSPPAPSREAVRAPAVPPAPAGGPARGAAEEASPVPPAGKDGPGAEARAGTGSGPGPSAGTGADDGRAGARASGEADFRGYLDQVRRKVMRAWQESYEGDGAQRVTIRLRIERTGRAYGIQVLASTDARVNPGVVAAVERASPFPPIPDPLKSLAGEPIVLRLSLMPE